MDDRFTYAVVIVAAFLLLILTVSTEVVNLRRTARQNREMRDHVRRIYLAE